MRKRKKGRLIEQLLGENDRLKRVLKARERRLKGVMDLKKCKNKIVKEVMAIYIGGEVI